MMVRVFLFFSLIIHFTNAKSQNSSSESGIVTFSNFLWNKKIQTSKVGPGPNYFGLHKKNVFVDRKGNLHLSIKKKKKLWSCAEVSTDSILKEGTYEVSFYCKKKIMPSNAVLGLFLYDKENPPSYNEIDFELSNWNESNGMNAQHVVYNDKAYSINRFDLPLIQEESKHIFKVYSDSIRISSFNAVTDSLLYDSTFKRPGIFDLKQTKFRMNLWLFRSAIEDQKAFEVLITSFNYTEF